MSLMKSIASIGFSSNSHWVGNGFKVNPLFGRLAFTNELSPFLMLDYASPKYFEPTTRKLGVGQHPHRGFETVTIAFQGEVEHADSTGNRDVIYTGDVQWMTAGAGIIHEEYHSRNFAETGGVFEMIQLWVNLPAKDKMSPPKYQAIRSAEIPSIPLDDNGGTVRIIAGNFKESSGPATTFTPINIWNVKLNKDCSFEFDVEPEYNTMLFVRNGAMNHLAEKVTLIEPIQFTVFDRIGSKLRFEAIKDTEFMFFSGQPINEPIAAYGPFVMNTKEQLRQANSDYSNGRF